MARTPNGTNILIDSGSDQRVLAELKDTLPFFDSTIDYAILTHTDKDHIGGFPYVLNHYKIKQMLFSGTYKKGYLVDTFIKRIKENGVFLALADEKSDFATDDGVFMDIIFPLTQYVGASQNPNERSIVAKLIYGENEILLTGDSEAPDEEKILASGANISADILKAGHHGSNTSTTEAFLRAASPKYGIISVGAGNSFHHPHPSTLKKLREAGVKILRTDLNGRIEMIFDKEKILTIKTLSP